MAFNQKIRLQIISALDDAGIKATASELEKLESKVVAAQTTTQGLGKEFRSAFNPMEAIIQLAHGNVEGVTKALVQLGLAAKGVAVSVGTMTAAFGGIMLAVTGVKKLIDMFQEQKRAAKEAADATAKAFATNTANAIKAFEAEYKLEMEKSANPSATRKKFIERQKEELRQMGDQLASYERQATDKMAKERKRMFDEISVGIAAVNPGITPEELRKATYSTGNTRKVNRQMAKWVKDNHKELYGVEIDALVNSINETDKNIKRLEAEAVTEEKKAAEEKAANEKEMAEKVKAIQEAAKMEEMKLEEERHRQRMKNLEAEANAAKSALNEAKSRFEREFAMYKSADKGASAIEEEKADEAARKQLQKDAARYGGKWRIDELSRLYAANDEEGVKNTLAEWRKRKSFTPEVESMVRAAAASENVKTMEDRVAEIAENTKGLAEKVDELLTMKGE